MEENLPPQASRDDKLRGQESPGERSTPPLEVIEPEEEGGDPACWAHLLDDEGNLIENPS